MTAIAPSYTSCTVYLYPTVEAADRGVGAGGSGFVLGVPFPDDERTWHLYVVTNRHVVETGNQVVRVNTTNRGSTAIPTKRDA
jgi:hypothetical protein